LYESKIYHGDINMRNIMVGFGAHEFYKYNILNNFDNFSPLTDFDVHLIDFEHS